MTDEEKKTQLLKDVGWMFDNLEHNYQYEDEFATSGKIFVTQAQCAMEKARQDERNKWIETIKKIKDNNNDTLPNKITILDYIIDKMENPNRRKNV